MKRFIFLLMLIPFFILTNSCEKEEEEEINESTSQNSSGGGGSNNSDYYINFTFEGKDYENKLSDEYVLINHDGYKHESYRMSISYEPDGVIDGRDCNFGVSVMHPFDSSAVDTMKMKKYPTWRDYDEGTPEFASDSVIVDSTLIGQGVFRIQFDNGPNWISTVQSNTSNFYNKWESIKFIGEGEKFNGSWVWALKGKFKHKCQKVVNGTTKSKHKPIEGEYRIKIYIPK